MSKKFLIGLIAFILMAISSYAQPSMEEVKAALEENPSLLNTPQAEAELKKRGLTKEDVEKKLQNSTSKNIIQKDTKNTNELNQIEFNTTDNNTTDNNTTDKIKNNKSLNPFYFEHKKDIDAILGATQVLINEKKLSRYALNFYKNKNIIDSASLPTPDDYIITTGDVISIHVYGDRDKTYTLKVENDGSIDLPFIGPLTIGGMKYAKAKEYLKKKLKIHFKNSSFKIRMEKYTTIQVVLVGDVKAPGIYNLSSFSTIKDLLLASKGVNDTASVRDIIIKRDGKIIARLDFYDLLFKGQNFFTTILKHGDIIYIHKANKLVSIDGFVNNAAVFELKDFERLDKLLYYAGGLKPNGSKLNIKVTRYKNNEAIKTFNLTINDAKKFLMLNGDKVYVYPLDYSAKKSVNIYGNVIRPGSYELDKNYSLHELLKKEIANSSKRFFLPETYFEYAVVKSYAKDLSFKTKSFNLLNVINAKEDIKLNPNDEIFIFSQNDIFTQKYVTTIDNGNVLKKPGNLKYFKGMTLEDAINASGIKAMKVDDRVRLTTYNTANNLPKTTFVSLKEASSVKLNPYDEIEVFDYYIKNPLKPVSISGEVNKPLILYYEDGMTLKNVINRAGGLKNTAYTKKIEIVRYALNENQERVRKVLEVNIENKPLSSIKINPYDEIKIFRIPKWGERKTITLKGEVKFPGEYVIENGDKLADVIKRAGGFTNEAFIKGAVFTRESIRRRQVQEYKSSLARVRRQLAIYNAMPANKADNSAVSQEALNSLNQILSEADKYTPLGRISLHLEKDLKKFEKSPYNLTLKDKDTLTIPNNIDTVTVFGEVFNPTSFVYNPELDAQGYIKLASGFTRSADDDNVYIIHADGTSEPIKTGWFGNDVKIQRGDIIVVPIYIKEYNVLKVTDTVSKIMASFALTVATLNSLGVF